MHELSIALSLLDLALEAAARYPDARVVAVHAKVGQLSGVLVEALQSAYELGRQGTPLEDAHLVVEVVPIRGYCSRCQGEREALSAQNVRCRDCTEPLARILQGREIELSALEIES